MAHSESYKQTFNAFKIPKIESRLGTGLPKTIDQCAETIKAQFGAASVVAVEKAHKGDPFVVVNTSQISQVLQFLRDDQKFLCQQLLVIAATDIYFPKAATTPAEGETAAAKPMVVGPDNTITVTYVVMSYLHKHQLTLKVYLPRDNPRVPTVCGVFRSANWYERECYDMLGVIFEGHPDHRRILLPPDWVGHPLRKDYVFPEEYNGMKVPL